MVRRRTGSKALEQSLYGGAGGDDSEGEGEGAITEIGYGDVKAGGRGLGALISNAMEGSTGSGGGGGSETAAESRPLLGRSQSSARVRVREEEHV